jgi:hypothetical protein
VPGIKRRKHGVKTGSDRKREHTARQQANAGPPRGKKALGKTTFGGTRRKFSSSKFEGAKRKRSMNQFKNRRTKK